MIETTVFEPPTPDLDYPRPMGVRLDMPTLDQARETVAYVWRGKVMCPVQLGTASDDDLREIIAGAKQAFEHYRLSLSWNRWQGARLVLQSRGVA